MLKNTASEGNKRHRTGDLLWQDSTRTVVQRADKMMGVAAPSHQVASDAKAPR